LNKDEFILLITRYREGNANELEEQQLINYFSSFQQPWDEASFGSKEASISRIKEKLLSKVINESNLASSNPSHSVHYLRRFRWAVAAVIIFLIGIAYYSLVINFQSELPKELTASAIEPGKDGARLKLSDGRIVMIDSLQDGLIAKDGNISVYKVDGKIVYKGKADQAIYNEIVTDNGRQWSAQLPDGSTVWLNAASSIRYPLQFSGKERLVTMTGEASFSVIHNDKQPFRVRVKNQLVEDIGTEFNINAYDNESKIITTVIEGVASVSMNKQTIIVNAGKEASHENGLLSIRDVDTDKAIAWRKGLFDFDGVDIRVVGRQLERWYNIKVEYEGNLSNYQFGGDTYRNSNLQEVLKVLEMSGVKFRLEAGEGGSVPKLIVLPRQS